MDVAIESDGSGAPQRGPEGAETRNSPFRLAAGADHTLKVLDAIEDMVLVKGPESRIIWANKAFRDFYGMTNDQLQGVIDAAFNEPDYTQQYVRDDAQVFQTGESLDIPEEPVTRHDGQVFLMHTVKYPIRDDTGEVVMTVGVCRDITSSKQTEARLKIAERMASIGTLAAGVAHEINNPLTYVLMNLEHCRATLAGSSVTPDQLAEVRSILAEVADGAERVRVIVKDLQTFSREAETRDARVDLKTVIDVACRMARNEIRHRAKLKVDHQGGTLVDGNEAQLGQVFLNLLVNAAQAIPAGKAEDNEIRVVSRSAVNGDVSVEVHDTGGGISSQHVRRLFDPFFTTKPIGKGTGLGLSIVHNLVTAHGGAVEVESVVGKGSVFRVRLPAPRLLLHQTPTAALERAPQGRPRVLVVDDEPLVLKVLKRVLGGACEVITSKSGSEALQRIGDGERFDVIVCDVSMPRMTGAQFFDEVSRVALTLSQRFIFMTGGVFTGEAQRFLEGGTHRWLDKPLQKESLMSAIQSVLDQHRTSTASLLT